jgi:hypothetical protein
VLAPGSHREKPNPFGSIYFLTVMLAHPREKVWRAAAIGPPPGYDPTGTNA